MNTPSVKFKTVNLTDSPTEPTNGIVFVLGKAKKGPVNKPSTIITSYERFKDLYGGLINGDMGNVLVKRLLEKGASIRFCRIEHYEDIDDLDTLDLTLASPDETILDSADNGLFELGLKYPGAAYNGVKVNILAGSNGSGKYFNILIENPDDSELNELYENLTINGRPNVENSDYLRVITETSALVNVIYKDLSAIAGSGTITPVPTVITYEGATDGADIVDVDIIGSSATSTGVHAFNDYDDSYVLICVIDRVSVAVLNALSAYVAIREDIMHFIHVPNTYTTQETISTFLTSLNIANKYTAIFGGGIKGLNPISGSVEDLNEIADVAALSVNSDINFGPWYPFSGSNRGIILNSLGVVNNFGSPAKKAELNVLSNLKVNMVINRDKQNKLISNFTSQLENNQESLIGVVKGIMYIKKALRPLLDKYLEEPNDMTTWKTIYYQVKPFLDSMVDRRALYSYQWLGDQDAKTLNDLVVNQAAQVTQGKYKVKLLLSFIPGIQEIEVTLVLTPGNLTFETANQLT
jgi:hypothetical protein